MSICRSEPCSTRPPFEGLLPRFYRRSDCESCRDPGLCRSEFHKGSGQLIIGEFPYRI